MIVDVGNSLSEILCCHMNVFVNLIYTVHVHSIFICLIVYFIIHSVSHLIVYLFIYSLNPSFIYFFICSYIYLFIWLFIYLFIDWFIYLLIDLSIHWFIYLLIDSFQSIMFLQFLLGMCLVGDALQRTVTCTNSGENWFPIIWFFFFFIKHIIFLFYYIFAV